MNELSSNDRKILNSALEAGRRFESAFNLENESAFRRALAACDSAESPLVQKLGPLVQKVSMAHGPKHLMALLVPIERLSGRLARDEEFLFFERDREHPPIKKPPGERIVLCENIRSAFNVGAIFRTGETFAANEIWMSGYTPDPQKTAMGTETMLNTQRFERSQDAIKEARARGIKIVALETSQNAVPIEEFNWPTDVLLILGNERFGVDSQTLAECDHIVRISSHGQKNSLNVGIAFGIAAAGWRRPETQSQLNPIGTVHDGFQFAQTAPRQGAYAKAKARIELFPKFEGHPSNFDQALEDLDGFERAWIIFGFHQNKGWLPKVRPPRGDGTQRGLFSTRSPHRPSRLGLTSVKIEAVFDRTIEISEHDLLEGTPIYDIKPYVPEADAFPNAKAGWLDSISEFAFTLFESPEFTDQANWLEVNGERKIRDFTNEQLRFQPYDDRRKRIENAIDSDIKMHTIAFRTWRIDFLSISDRELRLCRIRSGYSEEELNSPMDPYNDKNLHRRFVKR